MASRVVLALAGGVLALFAVMLAVPNAAVADQRLQNGGFEQGTAGWAGGGLSASGCTPRSGAGALNLSTAASSQNVLAQQTIAGPFGAGNNALSGFYKVGSGAPSITVAFIWRTAAGDQPPRSQTLGIVPGYTAFGVNDASPPAGASSLVVKFTVVSTAASMVCFDDLGLDAPPPPPPTPIPTLTLTATLIPTAIATQTPTPTSVPPSPTTSVPPPTSVVPSATSTTIVANGTPPATPTTIGAPAATRTSTPDPGQTAAPGSTTTPTPTSTPISEAVAAGDLQFVNGGFEQGLLGWQRYGGDLQSVSSPTHSGAGAAMLSSNTTSTKWAYQVVAIDPTKAYEFNGYVRPSSGVKSAYLRISWYEASDGGGSAISTDDSTKLSGANEYSYVTTGGIAPPPTAHSARLRVMLAPDSASTATVHLDDLSFVLTTAARPASKTAALDEPVETAAATATPKPADAISTAIAQAATSPGSGTPEATASPETPKEATAAAKAAKTSTASASKSSSSSSKATATPKNALTAEVAGLRSDKTPEAEGDSGETDSDVLLSPRPDHHSKTATVAAGLLAAMIAAVGSHALSKRPR